jgi:methionyl-tRNA synthetase
MLAKFGGGAIPEGPGGLSDEDSWAADLSGKVLAEYAAHFKGLALHRALGVTWELITTMNRFIDTEAPWLLVKDPAKAGRLKGVLYRLVHSLALVGAMIWPVMPKTGEEIWRRLGLDFRRMTVDLPAIRAQLTAGRAVAAGEPLFPRVEFGGEKAVTKAQSQAAGNQPAKAQPAEAPKAAAPQEAPAKKKTGDLPPAESITFEEFKRLDLRVAEVTAAERVPKSDKLLKLTVKVGEEERTIVAGMGKHYTPEQITGLSVIIVANLAPAKLMGITSQGMVLAAAERSEAGETLALLTTHAPMPSGLRVS